MLGSELAAAASGLFSTFPLPPPGWCLMLSVEPILERTFFRSGVEVLLVGRGALAAPPALLPPLAVVFLASADTVEAEAALGAPTLALGRLVATPGALEAEGGVVALLLVALLAALLGRPGSAEGDFAEVFLASAAFVSVLMVVGLLGGVAAVVLAAAAAVTGDGAVVLGVAEELLEGVLGVLEDGGLDREVLFSVGFASVAFGLVSFGVKVEGRVLLVLGRLAVPGAGPAVGLVGFLFVPGVAELGLLGLVVAEGLAFTAASFGEEEDAAALVFFSGLGGSSLLGGAEMLFPVTASAALGSSGLAVGSCRAFPS